uniref:Uncharacterized protein LOC113796034 n=1 Tax=Dermatophagoides pteronyssinus TaxID=6956 RepID=A0A6P6YBS6_DERPT|nr:uncharacterized protein LOC113796034 [Dermatophagoides pteronyssinus]
MVWMLTKNKPPIQQITLEYNDDKHNQILKQCKQSSNNISLYPQFLPKNEYNQVFERLDLTQCSIVGYGYPTKEQLKNLDKKLKNEILQKPYGSLHSIHIPVMNELSIIDNNDICLRYYNDEYRPKETFCIGPEQSSLLAIFNGDHGSPLICSSLDGGYRVLGLITNQLQMNTNNHRFPPILFTNTRKSKTY